MKPSIHNKEQQQSTLILALIAGLLWICSLELGFENGAAG